MSDPADLGHPVFDADNHYYEAIDAFTRHLDPSLGASVVQWCEIEGRKSPARVQPRHSRFLAGSLPAHRALTV